MAGDARTGSTNDTGISPDADVLAACAKALARLRQRRPRVQCLTNTVAQPITANLLLAVGARVSMATHPDEVIDMTRTAEAVLINLGTLDTAREQAIGRLVADATPLPAAVVLDPVFVELSPVRMALARRLIDRGGVVVKGNSREMTALAAVEPALATRCPAVVTTGPTDMIQRGDRRWTCSNGHHWMGEVSGVGCAAGALIAAMRAVADDASIAALAGIASLAIAGEIAAERAAGAGSFAVHLIDALGTLDSATFIGRAKITTKEPR